MSTPPPIQLAYAEPVPCPFPWRGLVALSLIWVFAASAALAPMVFIVPHFTAIFRDFGTKLPLLTELQVNSSRWLVRYGLVVWAAVIAAPITLGVVVALNDAGGRRLRRAIVISVVVVAILLIGEAALVVIGVFAPMLTLMQ